MPCNLCGKWNCVCQYSQSKQEQEFTSGFFSREAMKEHSDFHPQPKQEQGEPVFHLKQYGDVTKEQLDCYIATGRIDTRPQHREWVELTKEETCELWQASRCGVPRYSNFASLINAKLKEKNT